MSRRPSILDPASAPPPPPAAAPPSDALQSPLKQVNSPTSPSHKTKFYTTWSALTTNSTLFKGKSQEEVLKAFNELFCLKVEGRELRVLLEKLETEELLGIYKNNITQFFTSAVKILKDTSKEDIRRANVVETLIPFLRNVLGRSYSNYSFDLMTLLTGSLERSDAVFTDLVCAIDLTLQDSDYPIQLRHRTLQLALTLVSSINQGSINAYFLRRDLFSTLTKFIEDPLSSPFAYESALLLGLLSGFRKYEARNPYLVRMEDFVDEGVMIKIIQVVTSLCISSRDSYTRITDDSPPSFVASLTSLVFSLRISEFLKGFSLSLPEAPKSRVSEKMRGKMREVVGEIGEEEGEGAARVEEGKLNGNGNGNETNGPKEEREGKGADEKEKEKREKERERERERDKEEPFKDLPPEALVILLPFYNLLNSNKVFCNLVFSEDEDINDDGPSLTPSLISLSSYIFCHAAVSQRARSYSRLCLILLTILVEEGEGKLTSDEVVVRLCRQRLPMLPYHNEKRPLIAAMLDSCVIYLRHNLHRKLDAETFIVCLKLVQRIMQQLKTERVRLDYDWVAVWRAMLLLSAFIVSKIEELRSRTTKMDDLISQIFIVLSYAAYWGETFFPSARTSTLLHYELLHADETLDSLSDLLGITSRSHPPSTTPESRSSSDHQKDHARDTPTRSAFFVSSPRKSHFASDPNPSFLATECVSNIRSSISFFSVKIDDLRKRVSKPDEIEVEQVVKLIEANLNGVDLIDAVAMADLRRYSEQMDQESYFKTLAGVACLDALALIPTE